MLSLTRNGLTSVAMAVFLAAAGDARADDCIKAQGCVATPAFTVTLSEVRSSSQGIVHYLTLSYQFRNPGTQPLTLGYVAHSGVVMDDRGNRYREDRGQSGLRGIGVVTDRSIDPRFTLAPGESAAATITFFGSFDNSVIRGTLFNVDFAVAEIQQLGGNQFRTARQHSLGWRKLSVGEATAAVTSPAGGAAAASAPVTASICKAGTPCVDAGTFDVEIVSVVESMGPANRSPRTHNLRISLRATNRSERNLTLGYNAGSALAVNSAGNRYTSRYIGNLSREQKVVQGIGLVGEGTADPSFVLAPGASRNFSLEIYHNINPREQRGSAPYSLDLTLAELERTPSNQVLTLREHSVSFPAVTVRAAVIESGTRESVLQSVVDILRSKKR